MAGAQHTGAMSYLPFILRGAGVSLALGGLFPAAGQADALRQVTTTRPVIAPVTQTLELTGTITTRRHARLSARTSGLIQHIPVDAGSVVKEGDVLLELDATLAALALERAQAGHTQAELEIKEADRLVEESARLAKVGGFSRSEAQSRETTAQVRRAQAASLAAQAREQEELVARHRLPAPFDGVISRKLAEEGEWVQTGTPVLELVETGALRLDVQAPQEALALLREAAPSITITLDAFPARPLAATLQTHVPVKDAEARTFLMRLAFADPDALAAPGMSARVSLAFERKNAVLQVPRDAVVRFPDGTSKVWVAEANGENHIVNSRTVTLGPSLRGSLEVLSGLEGTPLLVLRGNEGLREGQPVHVLEAPAPASVK